MADFNLPNTQSGNNTQEIVEIFAKMSKTLDYLLRNIDSKNVTELNTNITNISSENGVTTIDGNLLIQTDGTVTRLIMGYDDQTGVFKFSLFDENGDETFVVDSTGTAVFKGDISTTKDARVGNDIYLGDTTQTGTTKTIYFNDSALVALNDDLLVLGNFLSGGDVRITSALGGDVQVDSLTGDIQINGSRIGFHGATPIAQQTFSAAPDINEIVSKLKNTGLFN